MKTVKKQIKIEVSGDVVTKVNFKGLENLKGIHWNNAAELMQNTLDYMISECGIKIDWNGKVCKMKSVDGIYRPFGYELSWEN
jgi:hypothetical protein